MHRIALRNSTRNALAAFKVCFAPAGAFFYLSVLPGFQEETHWVQPTCLCVYRMLALMPLQNLVSHLLYTSHTWRS